MKRRIKRVLQFGGVLVLILLMGGISTLAAIGSISASDSCGGCDATPGWASVGMAASEVLLVLWLACVVVRIARKLVGRARPETYGS